MSSNTFPMGSYVWIPDEAECFLPGRVTTSFKSGEKGVVTVDGQELALEPNQTSKLFRMDDESLSIIDNMVKLRNLNEASILHNLRLRFAADKIYTNVGNILVSVNPFKLLPIYTPEVLDQYRNKGSREQPPHVYGVADTAYRSMMSTGKGQACIVSGESGAGKTEATKLFLQYITEASSERTKTDKKDAGSSPSKTTSTLQEQILKANPLMEAFGNAKTVRNNNSSRFGKWIQVKFDGQGKIVGGSITNYLLEKSRIVKQTEGERNYHVFYQICKGAKMDSTLKNRLKIRDPDEYYYLSQSGTINVEGINDERDWEDMTSAMEVLGMAPEEKEDILRSLAGILHLGNIRFAAGVNEKTKEDTSTIENQDMIQLAADQLGVDQTALERALTSRNIGTRSIIYVSYDKNQAGDARDALAKTLYGNLFDWLIRKINLSLRQKQAQAAEANPANGGKAAISTGSMQGANSIGVLDIFGFESFETNSFEQLCINYCNEKLQFHFNEQIFKLEQQEYKSEGVDVSAIQFVDNQPCLNLIEEKGTGILSMIDEEIQVPKGSDTGFLNKLISRHSTHQDFRRTNPKQKDSRNCFTVVHYAGPVHYNVTGFLEKNKDQLHIDLSTIMQASKIPFVRDLFTTEAASAVQKRASGRGSMKKKTLGTQFKGQLSDLMGTLNLTNPHFIRCIKPNSEKEGDIFTSPMILSQLRYAGLLEVCRIRQIGYPIRKEFAEFLHRYLPIHTSAKSAPDLCKALEESKVLESGDYQIGHTKVFLRNLSHDHLESQREQALKTVVCCMQRIARKFVARNRYASYKIIIADLKRALDDENAELLAKEISNANELPYGGAHLDLVKKATARLLVLEEAQNVKELLAQATQVRDYNSLTSAIQAAKEIKYVGKDLEEAENILGNLAEEKQVRDELTNALKDPNVERLSAAIAKAKEKNLHTVEEFRQASALCQRMEDEEKTGDLLKHAIADRDLKRILELMSKMAELGLDDPALLGEAQAMRDSLQEMGDMKRNLQVAIDARSLESLIKAIAKVDAAPLNNKEELLDPEYSSAKALFVELEKQQNVEGALRGAMGTENLDSVKQAIDVAVADGLTASTSDVLKEAIAMKGRLESHDACLKALARALESAELNELSEAVAAAADLGITSSPEFVAAQNVLKKLGTRAEMSSKMSSAIAAGEVDLLQELLVKAEVVQGMEKEIENAKQALGRFQDEKVALTTLREAADGCEVDQITQAMEQFSKYPGLVAKNSGELDRAKSTLQHCKQIEAAMSARSIPEIQEAIDMGKRQGRLRNVGAVERGEAMLKSLKIEADIVERLKPLITSKDKDGIVKLLDLVPDDMPPNDVIKEAQIMINREKLIVETKAMIQQATNERDLDILNEALQKVFELGLVSPEVEEAKKLHIVLTEQRSNCAEVVAEMRTLETKAKSKFGVQVKDVQALGTAIDGALEKGLSKDVKELATALKLKARLEQQIVIQDELKAALLKGDFKMLKRAMEHAQELDVELELAAKVRTAVRKKDIERRAAQRAAFEAGEEIPMDDDDEDEVGANQDTEDEEEVKRLREEKIKKARHDRYRFEKFRKLRAKEDFVKGVFFNKKKLMENMLQYQSSVIPRSITELDRDLSKVATRIHKSILGYCGDKSMSFPETLAQDMLTKALENPDLIDEIYIQLCKHLTSNPKPESIGRCWQLMCMSVGTFPPSSDFEFYLIHFIANQVQVPGLIGNYARYALRRLEGMLNSGPSGFVPSVDEIQSYKERPPILATIQLVDSTHLTEDLPITPDLDVSKVLDICLHFLDIEDERRDHFGIFVVDLTDAPLVPGPGEASKIASELELTPRPLRGQDFLGDVVVQATRMKREVSFVFKRKIFLNDEDGQQESEDPIFNRLLFLQAQDDLVKGNLVIEDRNQALELAVIALTVDTEEFPDDVSKLEGVDVMEYIPAGMRDEHTEEEWKEKIVERSTTVTVDTADGFQALYVEIARKYPLYGACLFQVQKVPSEVAMVQELPEKMYIGFDAEGMHFLGVDTREVLHSFGYADMYRWGGSSTQFSLIIWDATTQDTFEMSLYTTQASDMAGLILDYINAIMASSE